jgi:hypothetical protein
MEDLLLPVKGELKDLHPPRDEHVKTSPFIPLGKDGLASLIGAFFRYTGKLIMLRARQTIKKWDSRNLVDHLHKFCTPNKK